MNARDRWGKTPPAYWREPRDFEIHWFRMWLMERISGISLEEAHGVGTETIAAGLGGLPEETRHGAVLAADAVKALLKKR